MMIWDAECARCKAPIAVWGLPPEEDTPAYCPRLLAPMGK